MLGGMARELDSDLLRRLQEQYREMSDGELLDLAGKPDELTDVALEVLRGEMAHRGLKAEPGAAAQVDHRGMSRQEFGTKLPDGSVVLMTFNDALAAGNACDFLEAEEIEVNVRDASEKNPASGSFYGGPAVALQVIVPNEDRERAVRILREKMGLFPLQEVEEADELVDDGTVTAVGFFGKRADAEEVGKALEEAGIWHRIVANEEGSVEDENAFSLEVREVDLFEAGDVVEKALG
jgi:Putative prokaryotic signal transducing protein